MSETEDRLPEGALIKVELLVRLPVAATDKEIEDWLNANVASTGSISTDNPLLSESVEAWGSSGLSWEDTGDQGRSIDFDHEDLGGGRTRYRTRHERTRR